MAGRKLKMPDNPKARARSRLLSSQISWGRRVVLGGTVLTSSGWRN